MLVTREDGNRFLFADRDFSQGYKPSSVVALRSWTARDQALAFALRLPGVASVHFSGTWRVREADSGYKLLGVGYWLTRELVDELMHAAGGLSVGGEWVAKSDLSEEEFHKGVVREYQRRNRGKG